MALDYRALAAKYGGVTEDEDEEKKKDSAIDYAALAAQYGGTTEADWEEPTQETPTPDKEQPQEEDKGLLGRLGI